MRKTTEKDAKLGRQIRKNRKRLDLTQEELAEKAGISTTHLGLVETGKRRVSLKTLQKLAEVLKVKAKDLVPF